MGQATLGLTPLPGGAAVVGSDDRPLYRDSLVNVGQEHKKELMHLMFPPGTYKHVSLGRLSVDFSVAPVTSEIYLPLAIGFMRTDAWCVLFRTYYTA